MNGFDGDFAESGGDCYSAMMAAYNYYANVLGAIQSEDSHGMTFNGIKQGGHPNRMAMFKFNMKKWGNKLDDQGCECPLTYTSAINSAYNANKPIGKIS